MSSEDLQWLLLTIMFCTWCICSVLKRLVDKWGNDK